MRACLAASAAGLNPLSLTLPLTLAVILPQLMPLPASVDVTTHAHC